MVICLGRGADLHMAQLMPLPLTVSCFNKMQIGFTFLVPAHLGSPGKGPLNGCVCHELGPTALTFKIDQGQGERSKVIFFESYYPDTHTHNHSTTVHAKVVGIN